MNSLFSPRPIYLDYAATSPVAAEVREAMLPFLGSNFGNPSSVHQTGQSARRAVDAARDILAKQIECDSSEVYFTSGGTEADNTALVGVLLAGRERGRTHLVTSTTEHHAILDCAKWLETALGFRVTYVPVNRYGLVDPALVAQAVGDDTALVSIMHANNEIGTTQPVREIAAIAHQVGAYFHTDAVQTFGQMPMTMENVGADLLALSAHKIYGPKGVGALCVRKGVRWSPLLHGGQQEREKRAGTENVPCIVGFGEAVRLLPTWRNSEATRLQSLRDGFIERILSRFPGSVLNGHPTERLPNNINVSFPQTDGETLLLGLDLYGIAASSGSACASGSIEPSHVLLALGLPEKLARSAVRFSLGKHTTQTDLDSAIEALAQVLSS